MEFMSLETKLLAWQALMLLAPVLFFAACILILTTNRIQATTKLVWLIGTLCLPILGPLLFFFKYASLKKAAMPEA